MVSNSPQTGYKRKSNKDIHLIRECHLKSFEIDDVPALPITAVPVLDDHANRPS